MYSKKIQNGSDGHCSIEDAKACMELVQLKIKNGKFVYFIYTRDWTDFWLRAVCYKTRKYIF